ncbi:hypothetical protein [Rhodovastum atsumiense]|uniref:Uncharacterized protein n=1 Tax=Rhodovastum atsumiense TaxID=504468 RepID=A0A5M6IQQ1_9PROT|nr:hypothetical protein [Rhodovastum atsumiense]KAA5609898.1 hypothetical protein F1189_22195 [Rhodovastum atsumiense]
MALDFFMAPTVCAFCIPIPAGNQPWRIASMIRAAWRNTPPGFPSAGAPATPPSIYQAASRGSAEIINHKMKFTK